MGISARCMRESIEAVARMAASLSASMGVVDLERVAKDTEEQEEKETNTDREREETQTPGARASDGEAEKCYGRHEKEGDEGISVATPFAAPRRSRRPSPSVLDFSPLPPFFSLL